ncbi:substrate-binding domain-containing protein [Pararobbsia silviterrae]|uniref:Sugar ABC transporter substrate-binding protein n=1 Tax=Pararobbsia silviterrae TaxID=1792498 RepID=A0A494XMP1_9BURK|nr:substrate-binding domain-containing protein [Pararobbsia silviterrae]RKP51975.1 sugar ABC transporter substrate-binding protein [Pararobbsia silviterrae]
MDEIEERGLSRRNLLKLSAAAAATVASGGLPLAAQAATGSNYVFLSIVTQVPFWSEHRRGLQDAAKLLGVQASFTGPLDFDTAGQARQLDEIVANKPAGILIFPGDADALVGGINRAVEAGIPVITLTGDVPKSKRVATISIDGHAAGRVGGEMLAKAIGGKGKVILGMFPAPNVLERVEGYKAVFKEKYPGIEVVDVVNDKADPSFAPTAYAQSLQAHPGVVGIGGTDGDSGKGAAIAVKEAGLAGKVKIIAMDRNPDMLKFFDEGIVVGSVAQKSYTESFTGLHFLHWLNTNALKVANNPQAIGINPLPEMTSTGVMPITPQNYKQLMG